MAPRIHECACICTIVQTYVIVEHINSIGTPLLESILNGGDGLVVVGSIKPYALEVLHLGITTSKTLGDKGIVRNCHVVALERWQLY